MRPTEAGSVLVEHATAVLAAVDANEAALARIRERLAGRLALGSFPTAMGVLVPRAIARLARVNPCLDISLHGASTPVLVERVRRRLLDVAVIAVGDELSDWDLGGLRRDVLLVGELQVAVPVGHRLAGRDRVPVRELEDEAWIVGQADGDSEPIFAAWPTLVNPRVAFRSRDSPSRMGIVAAGLGIAVLPSTSAESVPAGVIVVGVNDPAHRGRSAVALTPPKPAPAARAMVAALRTEAARIALTRAATSRAEAEGGTEPQVHDRLSN